MHNRVGRRLLVVSAVLALLIAGPAATATADTIQTGKWTGTLNYGGTPAPLAEGATFSGARM